MKIAYIIYDLSTQGGMERVTCMKANWLVNNGYNVDVIVVEQHERNSYFELDSRIEIKALGLEILNNSKKNILLRILNRTFCLRPAYRRAIKSALEYGKYDIVVSLVPFDHSSITSLRDGSVKIFETHFSYRDPFMTVFDKYPPVVKQLSELDYKINSRKMERYDIVAVLTGCDKEFRGLKNSIVMPNPVIVSGEIAADLSSKRAIAVGRYVRVKGFDRLLKAWKIVNVSHPDWILYIYGKKDVEYPKLMTYIEQNDLCRCVKLCDSVENIFEEYQKSSIFVSSSIIEGFPMALSEAMALGLSVIGFDTEGVNDLIINGKTGLLIENSGDSVLLAHGINSLIEQPEMRKMLSVNAKNEMENYTLESVMKKWDLLFRNIKSK